MDWTKLTFGMLLMLPSIMAFITSHLEIENEIILSEIAPIDRFIIYYMVIGCLIAGFYFILSGLENKYVEVQGE